MKKPKYIRPDKKHLSIIESVIEQNNCILEVNKLLIDTLCKPSFFVDFNIIDKTREGLK